MKKFLVSLLAVFAVGMTASAQRTDISLSYGGYTQMDASDMHDGWHGVNNAWGAITAAVNFQVAPKFRLGPSYTFSSCSTKGGPEHSNIAYHAIMLNGRYDYYRNSIVTLYAHLGLGAEISHMMPYERDSYNKSYFAFQVSPLGAQVGIGKSVSMFGEIGYGAQGLVQVGFRFGL